MWYAINLATKHMAKNYAKAFAHARSAIAHEDSSNNKLSRSDRESQITRAAYMIEKNITKE